jgi:hypothetical protein
MNQLPTKCPLCGGEITVTPIHSRDCDTTLEGRFDAGPFSQLSREQLEFVDVFIRCEGKFTRMENELGLSYPTIRNRLHEVMRSLGYEPGSYEPASSEEPVGLTDQDRKSILEDLDKGLITADAAMQLLQEKGG